MTDTLLRSLRDRLLDESEPLAGLLRKCLLLGAETGSESLREWARMELNGFSSEDEVPDYRKVQGVPISMDSISGNTWAKNQLVDRMQLPEGAWQYVPEELVLRQPIEELERLAKQERLTLATPGLSYAQTIWNSQLGPFQTIVSLTHVLPGSALAGIIGQIRTKLVDLVADLTADTPMSELPGKDQVDAAVSHRLGHTYNTTIQTAVGPVAIGPKAVASVAGMSVAEALHLLDAVQASAGDVMSDERGELLQALADLRAAVEREDADTGDVVKKVGKLRAIADKIGVASVSAATGGAAQALTELAVTGAFG